MTRIIGNINHTHYTDHTTKIFNCKIIFYLVEKQSCYKYKLLLPKYIVYFKSKLESKWVLILLFQSLELAGTGKAVMFRGDHIATIRLFVLKLFQLHDKGKFP